MTRPEPSSKGVIWADTAWSSVVTTRTESSRAALAPRSAIAALNSSLTMSTKAMDRSVTGLVE